MEMAPSGMNEAPGFASEPVIKIARIACIIC